MLAVAMPALVVAVDVTDRGQRFGNRAIDTAKEAGRVKNHDRPPVTAPVEVMKLEAVDTDVTAPRFLLRYTLCHDTQIISSRLFFSGCALRLDPRNGLRHETLARHFEIIVCLEIQPKFWTITEIQAQT